VLTDDAGIAPLNQQYFGKSSPTDVISILYAPMPGEDDSVRGEIHVNVLRAQVLGDDSGAASRELALYIAHGIDHLTGASDRTAAQRRQMLQRELGWLREAGKLGLLDGLL